MKNNLKIRINGICVKSLFLALNFSKNNSEIYFFDSIKTKSSLNFKDKFFTFTNSTKVILEDLKIWEKLEKKMYSFSCLSFYDKLLNKEMIFCGEDFYHKSKIKKNIGWTVKYTDLEELLLKQISNYKNIHFFKNEISNISHGKFDYEFNFKDFSKKTSKLKNKLIFNHPKSYSYITFKLMSRSDFHDRAYKIFIKNESITLIPISYDIYQIIWNANAKKLKARQGLNENLFLDNFSTIPPNEFKSDQIIGDIKLTSTSPSFSNIIEFENSKIFINEFNQTYNQIINNDLKSFLIDLKCLQKTLFNKKKSGDDLFVSLKIRFYINKLFMSFNPSKFDMLYLNLFKIFFEIPNLYLRLFILKFIRFFNKFIS